MISQQALKEFQQIWKEQTGQDLSDSDATIQAVALLSLMNKIYRPIKAAWIKTVDNGRLK